MHRVHGAVLFSTSEATLLIVHEGLFCLDVRLFWDYRENVALFFPTSKMTFLSVHIGWFWVYIGLFWVYREHVYIGLFWVHIGLFWLCVWALLNVSRILWLFCYLTLVYNLCIGLFWMYIGQFWMYIGLFWVYREHRFFFPPTFGLQSSVILYMSHAWMSHVTQINESYRKYDWIMSHTWMSDVTYMNESCHI